MVFALCKKMCSPRILCAGVFASPTATAARSLKKLRDFELPPATMALKFSMEKCAQATKRPTDDAQQGSNKIPKAGDVVLDAMIPKAPQSNRPNDAPIIVS